MTDAPRAVRQPQVGELWLPGMTLDAQYPTPKSIDLVPLWEDYTQEPAIAVNGVLGVLTPPRRKIFDVVSIDLCEVVRESSQGLHEATGVPLSGSKAFYQQGTWYDPELVGDEYERSVTVSVLQAIINNGLVKPVRFISTISALIRSWRLNGAFVVANTSTLAGCEAGTISHTLKKTMAGCFDGIVFPRGFDNRSAITKAQALDTITTDAGLDSTKLPIIHIDDSNGHHGAFRNKHTGRPDVTLLAPIVKGRTAPQAHYEFTTPLEAFLYANQLRNTRATL